MTRAGRDREPAREAGVVAGRVVASHGRDATIVDEAGRRVHCRLQGRRLAVVCGDRVHWLPATTEGGGGIVVEVLPRRNTLARIDARGVPEPVAANLTQVVAVLAPRIGSRSGGSAAAAVGEESAVG